MAKRNPGKTVSDAANEIKEVTKELKEVVKFIKPSYPDLVTGYPIEFYNMYKNMSDTLMWLSDKGLIVKFNIYSPRRNKKPYGNPDNIHGFYTTYESKERDAIGIQRDFNSNITIESTKAFNDAHCLTSSIRVNLYASQLANFRYTQVPKILDWLKNPTYYLDRFIKNDTIGHTASFNNKVTDEMVSACFEDRSGNKIFKFCADPYQKSKTDPTFDHMGIAIDLRPYHAGFISIPVPNMLEFINSVVQINMSLYASTMLAFLGMPPVGVGMPPDYMAKFDGTDHSIKKVNKQNLFNNKNAQTVHSVLEKANSVVKDIQLDGFKKEHDL